VAPGRVTNGSGSPYKVYTPFSKAWAEHGWRAPADSPKDVHWLSLDETVDVPDPKLPDGLELPEAGERAALRRWRAYVEDDLGGYDSARDRPDLDTTSHMSVHLKWGEIHPRTMLAALAGDSRKGVGTYRKELAWREFYADVLFQRPETAREYLRKEFAGMEYDEPGSRLDAWRRGRTGYPIVDAGMRQLRATGWMHNRVRMITASFLVKDLHVEWQHGARHFMRWLVDGDLASNQHGWQWVAGCGTDAAPYFRIFNPTTQGQRFDPDGDYVRRWVPELRGLDARHVHDPSRAPDGLPHGYPAPIVDHAEERKEALDRLERIKK
jgi:deoxyribodipyrimidine photo-lyase